MTFAAAADRYRQLRGLGARPAHNTQAPSAMSVPSTPPGGAFYYPPQGTGGSAAFSNFLGRGGDGTLPQVTLPPAPPLPVPRSAAEMQALMQIHPAMLGGGGQFLGGQSPQLPAPGGLQSRFRSGGFGAPPGGLLTRGFLT